MEFPHKLIDETMRIARITAYHMGVVCDHRTDDLVQDALLKVWKHWGEHGEPDQAYLNGIVHNACVDHFRFLNGRTGTKRDLNNALTTSEPLPGGEWPENIIEDSTRHFDGPHEDELRAWLLSNVTKDSRAREIAERTLAGERAIDIAKSLGVTEGYVSIVKKRLRENYKPKILAGESPFDARLVA